MIAKKETFMTWAHITGDTDNEIQTGLYRMENKEITQKMEANLKTLL